MKYAILTALAVALAAAPIAQAQANNDCTQMNAVVAASKDKFAALRGDVFDDGVFVSKVRFANANYCLIDARDASPYLYCVWQSETVAAADAQSLILLETAKFCLSEGWAWTDIAGQKSSSGDKIFEGYIMSGSGPNAGAHVQIQVEGVETRKDRLVSLEVYRR